MHERISRATPLGPLPPSASTLVVGFLGPECGALWRRSVFRHVRNLQLSTTISDEVANAFAGTYSGLTSVDFSHLPHTTARADPGSPGGPEEVLVGSWGVLGDILELYGRPDEPQTARVPTYAGTAGPTSRG